MNPALMQYGANLPPSYQSQIDTSLVSQYEDSRTSPYEMSQSSRYSVGRYSQYQYGVNGGQWEAARAYQRQKELNDTARRAQMGKFALEAGAGAGASAGMAIAGIGGLSVAGLAVPMAAAVVAGAAVAPGMRVEMERRRQIGAIAGDIDTYAGQMGFSGGRVSYGSASRLANRIHDYSMNRVGEGGERFFDPSDINRIHKLGVASGLQNAKGGLNPGKMKQYEKNFKDLVDTTEAVVKMLGTTIEGGMSVVKELQKSGFGTMEQVKNQVKLAGTMGKTSGIGAQNFMAIGQAGAAAVQGTGIAGIAGATQYQKGALTANAIYNAGGRGERAVTMAGGVAQAGAMIANTQFNVLNSGIGSKVIAYAMNKDGTINSDKLSNVMMGKAGARDVTQSAARLARDMGIDRVKFGMYKEDGINNMSATERERAVQGAFNAWRGTKRGNLDQQAAVFAGMYTSNPVEKNLFYQSLLANKGYAQQAGMVAAGNMQQQYQSMGPNVQLGLLGMAPKIIPALAGQAINNIGVGFTRNMDAMMYSAGQGGGGMMDRMINGLFNGLKNIGIFSQGSVMGKKPIDITSASNRYFGLEPIEYSEIKSMVSQIRSGGLKSGAMSTGDEVPKHLMEAYKRAGSSSRFQPNESAGNMVNMTEEVYKIMNRVSLGQMSKAEGLNALNGTGNLGFGMMSALGATTNDSDARSLAGSITANYGSILSSHRASVLAGAKKSGVTSEQLAYAQGGLIRKPGELNEDVAWKAARQLNSLSSQSGGANFSGIAGYVNNRAEGLGNILGAAGVDNIVKFNTEAIKQYGIQEPDSEVLVRSAAKTLSKTGGDLESAYSLGLKTNFEQGITLAEKQDAEKFMYIRGSMLGGSSKIDYKGLANAVERDEGGKALDSIKGVYNSLGILAKKGFIGKGGEKKLAAMGDFFGAKGTDAMKKYYTTDGKPNAAFSGFMKQNMTTLQAFFGASVSNIKTPEQLLTMTSGANAIKALKDFYKEQADTIASQITTKSSDSNAKYQYKNISQKDSEVTGAEAASRVMNSYLALAKGVDGSSESMNQGFSGVPTDNKTNTNVNVMNYWNNRWVL